MNKNSLVLYKNQPAVVIDRDGDKYLIRFCTQPATPGGKKAVYGEQGSVPALSIKDRISQMKEKSKEINKKSEKKDGE